MSKSIVVLSGGTATNELVSILDPNYFKVTYVLPILDNGGSSSEIIRVIGGPAIGDIRSRLTRLIPDRHIGLRNFLCYRLDASASVAKSEWDQIIDGSHDLWQDVPNSTKEIVRSFLLHIHVELLKRSRICAGPSSGKPFKFECANVGNLFLTAIRLFTGSLDSAIELFMKIAEINTEVEVLPCLNTNFSYHISAKLVDGSVITGQSQISHPSTNPLTSSESRLVTDENITRNEEVLPGSQEDLVRCSVTDDAFSSDEEIGNTPLYTHPDLKKSQLHFQKTDEIKPLTAPIERIMYVSPYGEEICPVAQPKVLSKLSKADIVLYSIGSLMTSIIPIVILKGVGKAIASEISDSKIRVLLLNGSEDRETSGLKALEYVRIISELAQYLMKKSGQRHLCDRAKFVTHLLYMENSRIAVDLEVLLEMGLECIAIKQLGSGVDKYDLNDLLLQLKLLSGEV